MSSTITVDAEQQHFMTKVYAWMSAALGATALTAWYIAGSASAVQWLFSSIWLLLGIFAVEIIMVLTLSALIENISVQTAIALFFGYAIVNGLTFSVIFLTYTEQSIAAAFLITAGMFGVMSIYGYTTKRDLSGYGEFFLMVLVGVIIASVANLFYRNGMFGLITSIISVLLFTGLTAYDTQRIKAMNVLGNEGTAEDQKEAIHGALALYLDFINLFLNILRLMGRRR